MSTPRRPVIFLYLLVHVLLAAVDGVLRPQLARDLQLVVPVRHRDGLSVEQLADLDRHRSQAAARAPHQHKVARLNLRPRHQHAPRGEEHQRHRRRLLPAELLRLRHNVERRHLRILSVRAVQRTRLKAPYLELATEEDVAAGAGIARSRN